MEPSPRPEFEPGSLAAWLRTRTPSVPEPFLSELLSEADRPWNGPEGLLEEGLTALDEALAAPGRDRAAAFRLLAGDAFLTYACEAAAEKDQTGETLERLLRDLGERFR